jgi:hypothetical protein
VAPKARHAILHAKRPPGGLKHIKAYKVLARHVPAIVTLKQYLIAPSQSMPLQKILWNKPRHEAFFGVQISVM